MPRIFIRPHNLVIPAAQPPVGPLGRPVGVFQLYSGTTSFNANIGQMNLDHSTVSPSTLQNRITHAITNGIRLILPIPGGAHGPYIGSDGKFDRSLWSGTNPAATAGLNRFNTTACKNAIAGGVAAAADGGGGVVGISIMDEPWHNSWGLPAQTIMHKTNAGAIAHWGNADRSLDSMADEAKSLFPTCPIGYAGGDHPEWRQSEHHQVVDWVSYQWGIDDMPAQDFLDMCILTRDLDGIKIGMGCNVVNGGYKIIGCANNVPTICCPLTGAFPTSGNGDLTSGGQQLCRLTPGQIEDGGILFIQNAAWFIGWRWNSTTFPTASSPHLSAFEAVKAVGDALPIMDLHR